MNYQEDLNHNEFFELKKSDDKILFLLKYAVRAPSTHNSQPWLFKIKKSSCEVYFNPEKKLLNADPKMRDLFISIGCCVENLIITTQQFGVYDSHTVSFEKKSRKIAEVHFNLNKRKKIPLNKKYLDAILTRSNRRGFYTNRKISNALIIKLNTISKEFSKLQYDAIIKRSLREKIVSLTAKGLSFAYSNSRFRFEMSQWFIPNNSHKNEGIPGYAINFPLLISIIFPYVVRFFNIGPIVSKLNKKSMISAPLISVISTNNESKEKWVEVGMLAQKQIIELEKEGIGSAVYVAAIEMGDFRSQLQKILGTRMEPQFLFCSGYIDGQTHLTPRHSVIKKLI